MLYKRVRLLLLALLGIVGAWALSAQSQLTPEGLPRQHALSQALAPHAAVAVSTNYDDMSVDAEAVAPVVVNLADVEGIIDDENGMYERWLRGEIDLDENDSIVSELQKAELQAEAMAMRPDKSVQIAESGPGLFAPTLGVSGDSLDFSDSGGFVPPDLELAAGPDHLIAVANTVFEIYDKSVTSVAAPTSFSAFMTGTVCSSGVFDPNVVYDEAADRFVMGIAQRTTSDSNYCLAVSQTSDPTGAWWIYEFSTLSGGNWMDYPHAGVGNEAIYMGGNIFTFGGSFVEGRIWAFPRALMYAGLPATAVTRGLGSTQDTPQPLNLHGFAQGTWPAGTEHYFLTETNYNGNTHTLFEWDTPFDGTNGTLTTVGVISLGAAGYPVNSLQSGGSAIQGNDWRPLDFEFRNGFGWTTMTVSCNPGSGTVNCVRWAQIDLSNATLGPQGSGTYSSNGDYRTFPDLAVNHCEDMAVGYTRTNTSSFPGIWVTGRQSTDPANTLQAETQLQAGQVTYTAFDSAPHRWGDYTGMTIDPDGETFWYLGEYSKNIPGSTRWGSFIGAFSYPCTTPTLPAADAYHRDLDFPHVPSPGDTGIEPDTLSGPMWVSQDIWVRNDNTLGTHQNPEFGQVNYVFARLRNSGPNTTPTDITGRIQLYWADASAGLAWDTDWTHFATIPVPNLAANNILEVSAPWSPPGTGHYCLLARWVSDQDPMTVLEGTSVNTNTRENNNIAWRNVNVVDLISSPVPNPVTTSLIVRNIAEYDTKVALQLAPIDADLRDPFLEHGTLHVDLGDELFQRWQENGAEGKGFEIVEENLIQILNPETAVLQGIPMSSREWHDVRLIFTPFPRQEAGNYIMGITQYDERNMKEPVGGVHYEINIRPGKKGGDRGLINPTLR